MGCGVRPAGEGNPAWNGRLHPAHRHLGRVPMAKDLEQIPVEFTYNLRA